MKHSFLATLAAAGLVIAGTASAAETRSAAAMPRGSVAALPKAGTVSLDRSESRSRDESELHALGLLPLLFVGIGAIMIAVLATKSNG